MSSSKFSEFIPKSVHLLTKGYTKSHFKQDLLAGITVGLIALPLAMAFAIASGVEPARGLYTAIIAGFLISFLGGSRIQIGGPTGAFVVILYDIIQRTGYQGLAASSLIAAVILVLLGIFRLGSWIRYIPHPLITGFTTGIAVIIFSTQIKDFLGLQMETPPADFIPKWISYFHALPSLHLTTVAVSLGTLCTIILIRRFKPQIPWGIGAIVITTLTCYLFQIPVETIQSRFGTIPSTLPIPSIPYFSIPLSQLKEVIVDAISIAFLGGIESLLSAVIGDRIVGGKHKSNCELIAQGIANFSSILFGGIPATGAIARTSTNAKTGAKTPLAGMIHAATLLFIMYCMAPIVSQIPLAALATILIVISWNMSEIHHIAEILKAPLGDKLILATALFSTVFIDITAAIFFGMIVACINFIKQMHEHQKITSLAHFLSSHNPFSSHNAKPKIVETESQNGTKIYEIQGPFFFGTANILQNLFHAQAKHLPKTCILRLGSIPLIDASGMHALKEFFLECKKHHVHLKLSELKPPIKQKLQDYGLIKLIGKEECFDTLKEALSDTQPAA